MRNQTTITTALIGIFFILIAGIVAAGGSGGGGSWPSTGNNLSNLEGINMPASVVAGDTFQANFSFDYLDKKHNQDNSSLILQLNFTSKDKDYPVWKGDFQVNGTIKECSVKLYGTCIGHRTVNFSCSEIAPLVIGDTNIKNLANGTFYCYNDQMNLSLNSHEEIILNITTKLALYPGNYTLSAQMFYLNESTIPGKLVALNFELKVNQRDLSKITAIDMYLGQKKVCTFSVAGNVISGCKGILIEKKNSKGVLTYRILLDTSQFDPGKYFAYLQAKIGNKVEATSNIQTVYIKVSEPKPPHNWYYYYSLLKKRFF